MVVVVVVERVAAAVVAVVNCALRGYHHRTVDADATVNLENTRFIISYFEAAFTRFFGIVFGKYVVLVASEQFNLEIIKMWLQMTV